MPKTNIIVTSLKKYNREVSENELLKMHEAYELRFNSEKEKNKKSKHKLKSKCK